MNNTLEYANDNMVVGTAELPAVLRNGRTCWVLPGSVVECDPVIANAYAVKLDKTISANLKKFSRTLFR